MVWELFERYSIRPPTWGQRPNLTLEVAWPLSQNGFKSIIGVIPSAYPKPKIQKKSFNQKPEARNSDNGEIMRDGWNSHMWSEIDRNCIFVDGLGAIWKIFNQNSHMRPEAKLDLRGHMTTQSKWYQINYRGRPKCLNAYPRPKIQKKKFQLEARGQKQW